MLTALGSKEAERKIIGCDLHAAQQTIAMLDRETGEIVETTWRHQAGAVREFYAGLPAPVVVGLEATGSRGWFLRLLDELGVTYRVGHPATIRTAAPRKQKHDRRDAALLLQLLADKRSARVSADAPTGDGAATTLANPAAPSRESRSPALVVWWATPS